MDEGNEFLREMELAFSIANIKKKKNLIKQLKELANRHDCLGESILKRIEEEKNLGET